MESQREMIVWCGKGGSGAGDQGSVREAQAGTTGAAQHIDSSSMEQNK